MRLHLHMPHLHLPHMHAPHLSHEDWEDIGLVGVMLIIAASVVGVFVTVFARGFIMGQSVSWLPF
ncbi:MAG: hypothetical protein EPO08_19410 [Rhodospirillaceae bacterium]|nr:MAG: hypothetical protein EPO08_19410 [Rhodospirillaceae bacterium]